MDGRHRKYDALKGQDVSENIGSGESESESGLGISYGPGNVQVRHFSVSEGMNDADTSYDPGAVEDATLKPRIAAHNMYQESLTPGQQSVSSFQEASRSPQISSSSSAHLLQAEQNFTETLRATYEGSGPDQATGTVLMKLQISPQVVTALQESSFVTRPLPGQQYALFFSRYIPLPFQLFTSLSPPEAPGMAST